MTTHGTQPDGRRRAGRWVWPVAAVVFVAALVAGGLGALHLAGPRASWLLRAVTSGQFIFCAVLLVVCAVLFAVVVRLLWELGRPYRKRRRSEDGLAIIEFTLAFPFLLGLALLMAQTSLVMVGNVCVHYSAFCAARAAVVTVPKDFGDQEPRNRLLDQDDPITKMHRIKRAAAWAVMPVSCGGEGINAAEGEIAQGVDRFFAVQGLESPGWADERLARKFQYAMDHTEVAVR
ncbi:MAG: TadE/TadG family type IV pilus assembly protein, partial [Planctomycetota bacterium]